MRSLRAFCLLIILAAWVVAWPSSADAQPGVGEQDQPATKPSARSAAPCSSGHAAANDKAANALPAIPRATRPDQVLVVRVVVEQPYIDNEATRVTYNGLDHVFGIEWRTGDTTRVLRVPEALVTNERVFADILDCTDKGVSMPERFTPLTAPRLFPYLIAVRDQWSREFDESLAASTKIAAVALVLSLRTPAAVEAAPAAATRPRLATPRSRATTTTTATTTRVAPETPATPAKPTSKSVRPEVGEASEFRLAKHGDHASPRPAGMQSHHGVMSAWMKKHYPTYKPNDAPAILMPTSAHQKTFGVYNKWRAVMKREMGGTFTWENVSEAQMRALSEKMFDAASVPPRLRADYWKWFDRMKSAMERPN